MAILPDGKILVTEQVGRLRIVENGRLLPDPVIGVPSEQINLLDVALDPDFRANQIVYLSYLHGTKEAATVRIWRAKLHGTNLVDGSDIFETRPAVPGLHQVGGRLAFGPDGLLYVSLGDRTQQHRAQDLLDDSGSILRLHPDGRIPEDNPFVGMNSALPEIFSYGHRNPQGLVSDASDGRIWSHEHGPKGGDEVNIIRSGHNYGWPITTSGIGYDGIPIGVGPDAPGVMSPVHYWMASVAPSGMAFYESDQIPNWRGSLLIGALAGEMLLRLEFVNEAVVREERLLVQEIGRIRDVRVGTDGFVYVLTDGPEGLLYRLEPVRHAADSVRSTAVF
jgi:aldose sugar dehydrogenase